MILREVGRIVGVLGSLGVSAACIALGLSWLRMIEAPGPASFLVLTALLALAIVGGLSALKGNALSVLMSFVVSFVPVGFYLLLTPGMGRWIGLLQLSQFVSATLLILGRRRIKG